MSDATADRAIGCIVGMMLVLGMLAFYVYAIEPKGDYSKYHTEWCIILTPTPQLTSEPR